MQYSEEQWISWIDELAVNDFVVVDDFIDDSLYSRIMNYFREVEQNDHLKKAGIGSSGEYQIRSSVRGDFIYWLDPERDQPLSDVFDLMNTLTEYLNRYCFLSLSGSEFHLAKYPEGTYYKRHLDQFNQRNNRQITVLLYLNSDWKPGDGGELKMYREPSDLLIEPIARRLLVFKSDTVEHEVLPTNIVRYSLTGWLLHQKSTLGQLL